MFSQCVWCEMISGKALCQNQQIWRGRCEIHTAFFRKLTSLTSEGVWARYDRLVTQSLVWVTGEGLNSGGCLLFGWWFLWVDVGSWSQQRHEKRKRQSTLRGFFSITLGKHVHTPLSATRSGHTVWCYSKFRRSTWLMIRNKGFCSSVYTHSIHRLTLISNKLSSHLYFPLIAQLIFHTKKVKSINLISICMTVKHILTTYLQLTSPQNQMKWVILHEIKPFLGLIFYFIFFFLSQLRTFWLQIFNTVMRKI